MNQMYPETGSKPDALEGDASHEVAKRLNRSVATNEPINDPYVFVDTQASNGEIITEDIVDGAVVFHKEVLTAMHRHNLWGLPRVGIEERIEAPQIHELSFGTVDAWLYDDKKRILHVWDYKFGRLVVEAFENWQGINYVAGLIKRYNIDGMLDQATDVAIHIVQPRAYHRDGPVRTWSIKASALRPYFTILNANAAKSLGPDAEARTGSHCEFCPGRHACGPALKAGLSLFEVTGASMPDEMSPENMGVQLAIIKRAAKQLEGLQTGFEEQIKSMLKSGKSVPGWCLESVMNGPKWGKPDEEVAALGDMFNMDFRKNGVKTVKQVLAMGVDDSVISAYTAPRTSSQRLAFDDGRKARYIFGNN
jgi:hypothetical protein